MTSTGSLTTETTDPIKPSHDWLWIASVMLIALLMRVTFLVFDEFVIDSDEAIVGLMAKHILERGTVPVFYYGQHYMGSLEPLLVSGVFAIFGAGSITLKIVPLFFSLLLIPLVYLLAWHGAGKIAGRIASLLIAIPPVTLVEWSTKARGGFIEILVIGVIALLLTIRWERDRRPIILFYAGITLGLGWWVNNQIVFFMLAIGAYLLGKTLLTSSPLALLKNFIVGTVGFFLGGAGFWIYNLNNDFASFKMFHGTADPAKNIVGLIENALPIILGARRFWETTDAFPGGTVSVLFLYLTFTVILLVTARGFLISNWASNNQTRCCRNKLQSSGSLILCCLTIFACLSVFSLSVFGSLNTAPRYLLPLYPVLFTLVAFALTSVALLQRNILLAALLLIHLFSNYWGGIYLPGMPFATPTERISRRSEPLIAWLKERNYSFVRTNYWLGYRLAFESGETIKPVIFGEPYQIRIPEYEEQASSVAANRIPYVLTPANANFVAGQLRARGYLYRQHDVGRYRILHHIHPTYRLPLEPLELKTAGLAASHSPDRLVAVVDGDVKTRWGSGAPQADNMYVELALPKQTVVRAIDYRLGEWCTDYPRALQIDCVTLSVNQPPTVSTIVSDLRINILHDTSESLIYLQPAECSKIILRQKGNDAFFDWSIAELALYR